VGISTDPPSIPTGICGRPGVEDDLAGGEHGDAARTRCPEQLPGRLGRGLDLHTDDADCHRAKITGSAARGGAAAMAQPPALP
jgi:hypothetical protein